ncbi:MAG: transcriptional regulator of arginine metabolism, partial [Myxococcota bacterium]
MRAAMTWRATLPDLLTAGTFRTQAAIVEALERRGAVIDQSAVSRELRRLGVRKVAGCYRMPGQPSLGAPIHSLNVAYGGGLAVLTTEPAFAAVVANAIDQSHVPGVLGT